MPLKNQPSIVFGQVNSPYQYRKDFRDNSRHTKEVNWINVIPRDQIDQDLIYSFGAFMTVCRIHHNSAEERIKAILYGEQQPVNKSGKERQKTAEEPEPQILNIEEMAVDDIRKFISQKFRGQELPRRVGAILQAHGYTISISKPGADGGCRYYRRERSPWFRSSTVSCPS